MPSQMPALGGRKRRGCNVDTRVYTCCHKPRLTGVTNSPSFVSSDYASFKQIRLTATSCCFEGQSQDSSETKKMQGPCVRLDVAICVWTLVLLFKCSQADSLT